MADRYNRPQVAIVEAESPEDALELLKHGLGDHSGVKNHAYDPVIECVPRTSKGRIITLALKRYGEVGQYAQVLLMSRHGRNECKARIDPSLAIGRFERVAVDQRAPCIHRA